MLRLNHLPLLSLFLVACVAGNTAPPSDENGGSSGGGSGGSSASGGSSSGGSGGGGAGGSGGSAANGGSSGTINTGATAGNAGSSGNCAGTSKTAEVKKLPVDIIWTVDNSSSMQDEIEQIQLGLDDFANMIVTADATLDYQVIMLSKRGTVVASSKYPVCIKSPLASNNDCDAFPYQGNNERFFHADVPGDGVRSTQVLEQFLGILAQVPGDGYSCPDPNDLTMCEARGGEPFKSRLRQSASKTLVFVSDDVSRLSAADFLHGAGGPTSTGSATIPPGILDSSWGGLFDRLVVHAMIDPAVPPNPDGDLPYNDLVTMTGGQLASTTDGPTGWQPFFEAIATAVVGTAPIDCTIPIPDPPVGEQLDPEFVNVSITSDNAPNGIKALFKVADASQCSAGGWYYDNNDPPTTVTLCPSSCDELNSSTNAMGRSVDVEFGCATRIE